MVQQHVQNIYFCVDIYWIKLSFPYEIRIVNYLPNIQPFLTLMYPPLIENEENVFFFFFY